MKKRTRGAPVNLEQEEKNRAAERNPAYASIRYTFSLLNGGMDEGMRFALLAARNPDNAYADQMKQVYDAYWKLPEFDRRTCLGDDLCELAGLHPDRFIGETVTVMVRFNMNVSTIVASQAHVDATKSLARMAVKDTDTRAKEMLFTNSGFLPQPKGSVINNYIAAQASASSTSSKPSLPSFEEGVIATSNFLRRAPEGKDT